MTLRFLLDTNIVSSLVCDPSGAVARRLDIEGIAAVAIDTVVACELRFGVAKSGSRRLAERVDLVLEGLPVLALEPPGDIHYAAIRLSLERAGTPIGPNDLLIAAHARARRLTLVTDNVRELGRVPGLAVENWLDA